MLTKTGCNAGACHGAAVGRGGFRLSLFGSKPDFDFTAIALERGGRRVNLADAEQSLVYLKPTESIAHGGGYLLDEDGEAASLLRRWLAQGAAFSSHRELQSVEVSPSRFVARRSDSTIQLLSHANYSDGSRRNVTRWTVFTPEDPGSVEVDPITAEARILRPGRHIVIARFLDQVLSIELLAPYSQQQVDSLIEKNYIDSHVNELLRTLGLPVADRCDDFAWIRRVTLDLTGRLPQPATVREFASRADQGKREQHVDRLLSSDAFLDYWTYNLAKLLRLRPDANDEQGLRLYHGWIRRQLAEDLPFDELAWQLLLATGNVRQTGPANFYRTTKNPREQAEFVSEVFMASRLRCANCHDHPLDRWTQDDYHGLASLFAKVELKDGQLVSNPSGSVLHPATGEDAPARIPGQEGIVSQHSRRRFVDWLTHPDNPFFAKAIVNRLWKSMMGRGLVEPVDDMRATNPATHPQLLDALANDFVSHKYSLRHTLKQIAMSAAYSRSTSLPTSDAVADAAVVDDRFYSRGLTKPLPPEVLADAVSDVLGVAEAYGQQPLGTRAVALVNPQIESKSLDVLGRCDRTDSCESTPKTSGGLSLKLHMMNGPLLNRRLLSPDSRLQKAIMQDLPSRHTLPIDIVQDFYWLALSRALSEEERTCWETEFSSYDTPMEQRKLLEDFVWGLLNCNEFINNH